MAVDGRSETSDSSLVTKAIGNAIRQVRRAAHLSQDELAARLASRVDHATQASVSRWERGKDQPKIEVIRALEEVLGERAGTIFVLAGLVEFDLAAPVEAAIVQDDRLDLTTRKMLAELYRNSVAAAGRDVHQPARKNQRRR